MTTNCFVKVFHKKRKQLSNGYKFLTLILHFSKNDFLSEVLMPNKNTISINVHKNKHFWYKRKVLEKDFKILSRDAKTETNDFERNSDNSLTRKKENF